MVIMRGLLAVFLVVISAGCAMKRPAEVAAVPEASPPPVEVEAPAPIVDHEALYSRAAEYQALYRDGIELIVSGEEVAGEERIARATNGLLSEAERCAGLDGCDVGVFFGAFDGLLAEQAIALKRQALRVSELEQLDQEALAREPGTTPFTASIPALERTASLLRGTDIKEMIQLNAPVKAALDDWLTWMRPMLMDSYFNYKFLRSEMAPVYEEAGLPEALLFAMMATESRGKVHSYSRAGAAGPLQFMSYTGRRYGLKVVDGFDLRLDPASATRANAAYMDERFAELNGSLEMALAAYNGGEGRMRGLKKRHGSNFWESKIYYSLPSETRDYVPRVLAAAWLFLHPNEYGLEFTEIDPEAIELVLERETALDELAICLGQAENPNGWFRTLRNLNPPLKPGERLAAGSSLRFPKILEPVYREQCLDEALMTRIFELHHANYPPEPELIRYKVRSGDTLSRIASRHRCASLGEIADLNRLRAPRYTIRAGQMLKIPGCH